LDLEDLWILSQHIVSVHRIPFFEVTPLHGIKYSFPADELGCGLKVNRDYVMLALLVGGAPPR
jgi:hypothetical protein